MFTRHLFTVLWAVTTLARPRSLTALTEERLEQGLTYVTGGDADMARILKALGPPPMWARAEGFATLLHIVLEQQVSLRSAQAAYHRLLAVLSPLTPEGFLTLSDATLKSVGFSRQKTAYSRGLAGAVAAGTLDLASFAAMDDAAVRAELTRLKGIGPWTADIYLLMALRRPDAWPSGDLALALAVQAVKGLPLRPAALELEAMSTAWRPWRAVAARLLWHYYLNYLNYPRRAKKIEPSL